MKTTFRFIASLVLGLVIVLVLVIAVELFSAIVHPLPPDFDGTMESMCAHVANYPAWVLAVVIPMWGLTAGLGTWISGRVGNRTSATVLAILLLVAVVWNVVMLPYPLWFQILQPLVILFAVTAGVRSSPSQMSRPRSTPPTVV